MHIEASNRVFKVHYLSKLLFIPRVLKQKNVLLYVILVWFSQLSQHADRIQN